MSAPTLGIFGGTFDPVHIGHLHSLWELSQHIPLDRIHLIPTASSPRHKAPPIAAADMRLQMLQYATEQEPSWKIDDRDIKRGGVSYTVNTLQSLQAEFPKHHLCCIIGMDLATSLHTWHQWETLFSLTHFIILTRPHYTLPADGPALDMLKKCTISDPALLREHSAGCVIWQSVTALPISATDIRKSCQQGRIPHFLLPAKVAQYIHTNRLYR